MSPRRTAWFSAGFAVPRLIAEARRRDVEQARLQEMGDGRRRRHRHKWFGDSCAVSRGHEASVTAPGAMKWLVTASAEDSRVEVALSLAPPVEWKAVKHMPEFVDGDWHVSFNTPTRSITIGSAAWTTDGPPVRLLACLLSEGFLL